MRRRVVLLATVALVGCADVLSLGGYYDADGSVDASAEGSPADVVVQDAQCVSLAPDEQAGIFVTPNGSADSSSCGTQTVPCKSVQTGLDRAHVITGKSIVYVARGTYAEAIMVYAGLRIEGGWDVLAQGSTFSWVKACSSPSSAFVLQPVTGNQTVTAIDLGGSATLSTLTVRSKQASPGESLYGVFARGTSTTLAMEDVIVDVSAGGDGMSGDPGLVGDAGSSGCVAAGGGTPPPGQPGSGADAGAFDSLGWHAIPGAAGANGSNAAAGTAGFLGTCVTCGSCQPGLLSCKFNTSGTSCGAPAVPGCGGELGGGGIGGTGGGSSIGIFAWGATVTIVRGAVRSSTGGTGGSGGAGAAGGAGGPALIGDAGAPCTVSCNGSCNAVSGEGAGGIDAGTGGAGSAGGPGGGGSGGSSFAIAQGGQANVTLTTTTTAHAAGGAGGGPDSGAGAPGLAADRFP